MPSITGAGSIGPTVTPTAGVAGATPVAPSNTPAAPQGTTPNATLDVGIVAKPVAINGLQNVQMAGDNFSNRFSRDIQFDTYDVKDAGKVERGFLRCDATAIPGGCRVHVQTFHHSLNDKMKLYLLAEVLDEKAHQLRTVTLAVLANDEELNGSGFRGERTYDIKYDDINAYLQTRNPNLRVTPGHTTLAVGATFPNGHQAGGFARNGTFRLPLAGAPVESIISVRTKRERPTEAQLPLDMQVAYPKDLTATVPQLKPDGNILSRLESEFKGGATREDMIGAIKTMYRLAEACEAGAKDEVKALLGDAWRVTTVNRYWLKDDGSPNQQGQPGDGYFKGFRVDADGLPIQDPMHDVYMDDGKLGMTKHEGAVRLRSNKQATVINVKPGGGRRDAKSGITQRVEVGLELKAEAGPDDASSVLRQLATGSYSGTVFNHAQKEVSKLDRALVLSECLRPWIDIIQDRHKFTLENEQTGVEIELSLDKVMCETLRSELDDADGMPRTAEFYVVEAELDHLQLKSGNQSNVAADASTNTGFFKDDQQQEAWLRGTSAEVTMDLDPRLHELEDLENASFRGTASYKAFEGVVKKAIPALFPRGLVPGRQKSAHAADVLGLVIADGQELAAAAKSLIEQSGFACTAAIVQSLEAAITDPTKREAVADLVATRGRSWRLEPDLAKGLQALGVSGLDYDLPKAKARVQAQLRQLGYESTPAIDAMLDTITAQTLPPEIFESCLTQMEGEDDAQVMRPFASRLGVASAPAPVVDADGLLSRPSFGRALAERLRSSEVEPTQLGEVEAFLRELGKAGTSAKELRDIVSSFHDLPPELLAASQRHNVAAKVPELRYAFAQASVVAQRALRSELMTLDDAFTSLLKRACESRPHAEVQQWVQSLGYSDVVARVAEMAQKLGIPTPAPVYDFDAVDQRIAGCAAKARFVYDDGIKQLVRDCLNGGVRLTAMTWMLNSLDMHATLAESMQASNVKAPSAQLPVLQRDLGAIEAAITSRLGGYAQVVVSGPALRQCVADLLAKGAPPSNVESFFANWPGNGTQLAAKLAGIDVANIAGAPLELGLLRARWQQALGAAWTPALEQYLDAAWPAAEKSPSFRLADVFSPSDKNQLTSLIGQWSGMAPPAGI